MNVEQHIRQNLPNCKLMQLATSANNKPWVCTVFYVEDENCNLYWLSLPTRRHSTELASNNSVAVTIVVKDVKPIIGMQAEGSVEVVNDEQTVETIMKKYVAKYNTGNDFYNNFVNKVMEHRLYKFTPKNFVLFDEVNFKGDPRQIWQLSN